MPAWALGAGAVSRSEWGGGQRSAPTGSLRECGRPGGGEGRGAGQDDSSGSWIRTPECSEVADRQLEADLGIEVTGMKTGNKRCSKKGAGGSCGRGPGSVWPRAQEPTPCSSFQRDTRQHPPRNARPADGPPPPCPLGAAPRPRRLALTGRTYLCTAGGDRPTREPRVRLPWRAAPRRLGGVLWGTIPPREANSPGDPGQQPPEQTD